MIEENNVNPMQNLNQIEKRVNGLNIAALVLGIVALVLWCVWFISIPCSILSLIFGIIGIKKVGKGLALTGIITGAIALVLWVGIFALAFMTGFIEGLTSYDDYYYEDYSSYRYY